MICHGIDHARTALLRLADRGGFVVVASLVYVGLQLKQNTQATRLGAVEHVIRQLREHETLICQSGDLAEIYWRGMRAPDSLEGPDRLHFHQSCSYCYKMFESADFLHRDGLLGDEVFDSTKRLFSDIGTLPGMRTFWGDRKHWCSLEFQAFIAREILVPHPDTGYQIAGRGE